MKAIFDTGSDTGYDDEIVERYHFPNRYLSEARRTLNDWIVYRAARRGGGRMAYSSGATVGTHSFTPRPLIFLGGTSRRRFSG